MALVTCMRDTNSTCMYHLGGFVVLQVSVKLIFKVRIVDLVVIIDASLSQRIPKECLPR